MLILIKVARDGLELEKPKIYKARPDELVKAAKTLTTLREAAKKSYGSDVELYVELVAPEGTTRIVQEDLDYILYNPKFRERSVRRERLPSQRFVQMGGGPLRRATEVLQRYLNPT